jgi:IS30 family transposase
MACRRFIQYVEQHIEEDNWSLDACFGRAITNGEFSREEVVCTKTLYNYIEAGLMCVKNIDLPEKVSRKKHHKCCVENKHKLDDSIEDRAKSIDNREEFGHWEIDSVLGKQGDDEPVVITMVERKTRICIWMRAINHTAEALMNTIEQVFDPYKNKLTEVFKTITADNGSEFTKLNELKEK